MRVAGLSSSLPTKSPMTFIRNFVSSVVQNSWILLDDEDVEGCDTDGNAPASIEFSSWLAAQQDIDSPHVDVDCASFSDATDC